MKNTLKTRFDQRARKLSPGLLLVVGGLVVLGAATAPAQESKPVTNAVAADAGKATSPSNQPPAVVLSAGITEILKMVDAGVSAEVVTTYIESSALAFQPTEKDIIALKEHKVPDDVVKLLLKRGAQARDAAMQARNEAILRFVESRNAASGGINPESLEYFQTYYLQPRAVAAANQRLYPYSGAYPFRGFTYGPTYGYGASFGGRPIHRGFR